MIAREHGFIPQPKQITLNREKVGVTLPIGLHPITFTTYDDPIQNTLVARLAAYVLTEHLATDTVTEKASVPATWRDHAKQSLTSWVERQGSRVDRAVFQWWLKRHPVQYRTVTLTATWNRKGAYPQSRLRTPDLGPVVIHESVSHSFGWDDVREGLEQ